MFLVMLFLEVFLPSLLNKYKVSKPKLIRITTIPLSLDKLIEGQLNYMNNFYEVTAISSDFEELKKVGSKENIKVVPIEMTRQITPFQDLKSVYQLYRFFKKEKPFIVHSHTPKAGIVSMLAAKLARVPNRLHTVAGLPLMEAKGLKRKILDFVEKLTYSCATKVYPNSKGLYEIILVEKFCEASKLKVVANGSSNGINTEHFNSKHFSEVQKSNLKQELGVNENDFVFIFVGRLVGDKGINELVQAFSKLQNPKSKLLLVGSLETDLDPLLPETLEEIESNTNIISVGFQKDVRPYFAISNALVFPSYREGFPNVVMQAGAMGLPSIVTNINGCNEIIQEKYNGIIIPKKNTSAIFEAMTQLLLDEQLYQKTQQHSREVIVERYEQKIVWQAILEEYKRLEKSV